ncbi:MAG: hypothetical protein EOO59_05960 [Hymenobacter sp.]|nr:MAG: hypothetical protein EOO59_05960 [Hymenobacter sp.]
MKNLSEFENNSAMQNPFAKPRTTPQWLLGSVCWTAGAWGCWLAAAALASWLLPHAEWPGNVLLLGGFPLVQATVWLKAVPRSWQAAQAAAGSVLVLPAGGWLLLLVGLHLYCLVLFLVGLAFALSGPMQF